MKTSIYVWKLNGVSRYVGKSVDLHRRMVRIHSDRAALDRAIEKYGYEAFEKEVICYCKSDELHDLEEFYIRELGVHRSMGGYNLTFGADGQSPGEAHPPYGVTGENHPSWGRKNSKQTLQRMSEAHRGITHSEEAKQKSLKQSEGKGIRFLALSSRSRLQTTTGSARLAENSGY